jgi:hypothetical protein
MSLPLVWGSDKGDVLALLLNLPAGRVRIHQILPKAVDDIRN